MASPEEMEAAMVANMKDKTGKAIDAWLKIAKKSGLKKHGEIVKHLKADHALTHGYANLVAHYQIRSESGAKPDGDLVSTQYGGAKADLRPIYDAFVKMVKSFGADVEISPKKAYVSLRRNKQFGLIQPSTRTRVDVGINLGKNKKATARLEVSGSFNAMVSHRVRVTQASDLDAELKGWLKEAYEAS